MNVTLQPGAKLPERGTPFAAGLDLFALSDCTVVTSPTLVETGVAMEIPPGYVGQIWSRSSMAFKNHVFREAGIIDSDYRNTIKVLLYSHGDTAYTIKAGDKVAQILIMPISTMNCKVVDSLSSTVRDQGGFGSTGK